MVDNGYEQDIRACLEVLENGGIILYPTDTVWGLGCDALNEAAINKLFMIKVISNKIIVKFILHIK